MHTLPSTAGAALSTRSDAREKGIQVKSSALANCSCTKAYRHNLPPRQRSLVVLIEVASAQGRSENVALIRHLTITGDHELNDVLAGNIPLPQNAKNMELATLFTVHPGLANLQRLCLEFPTFDAWHSLGDRSYQIWLNELPTSAVTYPIFLVWIFRAGVNDIFLPVFRFVTHPTNQ